MLSATFSLTCTEGKAKYHFAGVADCNPGCNVYGVASRRFVKSKRAGVRRKKKTSFGFLPSLKAAARGRGAVGLPVTY